MMADWEVPGRLLGHDYEGESCPGGIEASGAHWDRCNTVVFFDKTIEEWPIYECRHDMT